MTAKRPKARVSARGSKGNPAGKAPERVRAKRGPNYPKGHPQHPEMLKMAERARKAAIPKPETILARDKRVKNETTEQRGKSWADESLSANLNDSRILQLRRLYAHLSEAKEKNSLGNVVKLETLIAKIQGTLEPAVVEDPDKKKSADGEVDHFPGWTDEELDRFANGGPEPTEQELAKREKMVN